MIFEISIEFGPDKKTAKMNFPVGPAPQIRLSLSKSGSMGPSWDKKNANRIIFFTRLGIRPERVFGLKQIHSRQVLEVSKSISEMNRGPAYSVEGDGMVTKLQDIVLSVTVADCLPIFLHDTASGAFGIVHSGWKGTGIVLEAVRKLNELYGTQPADIQAIIGPGIGVCCYAVDPSRARYFVDAYGSDVVNRVDDAYYLDLRRANISLLSGMGLRTVGVVNECTCCRNDFGTFLFGSYRRQGPEEFTRMIALIGYET